MASALLKDAAAVVELLAKNRFQPMPLSDIARALDASPSSAKRWLDNLIEVGWARQTPDSKLYCLTDYLTFLGEWRRKVLLDEAMHKIEQARAIASGDMQKITITANPYLQGDTE